MKIDRFIKFLNNTELGKGNTHESYIYIKNDFDINFIFDEYDDNFRIKSDFNELYPLRLVKGNEIRIVGLGTYYRKYKLEAGDGVILERVEYNGKINFFISHVKKVNTMTLGKYANKGFEILTNNLTSNVSNFFGKCRYKSLDYTFSLKLESTEQKRSDSPEKTNFYSLELTGLVNNSIFSLKDNSNSGDLLEIIKSDNQYIISKIDPYFKQKIQL